MRIMFESSEMGKVMIGEIIMSQSVSGLGFQMSLIWLKCGYETLCANN